MSLPSFVRPPTAEPRGAIVLLHGRGTDERDLVPLFDELDPRRELVGIAPGAPLTGIPPGGRHWYVVERIGFPDSTTFHAAYAELCDTLDEQLDANGLDWGRTVIGGFSMGAVMSYAVGLGDGRPSPAGILAMSGFVPTVEGWKPSLDERAGLPVMIHHGSRDPIISVEFGRKAARLLEEAGLDVTYLETDAGHSVPPELIPPARAFVAGALAEPRREGGEAPSI